MFDIIRTFFVAYWYVIIPVVTLVLLAVPVIVYWYDVKYCLMNGRMRFPGIGRISKWVKNPGKKEAPSEANPRPVGFYSSEIELCRFYEAYYRAHQPSEANFRRNQDYLGKINEDGRREKGLGLWSLIIVLMLIEATAFGFALAPFALTLATPNTALAGAFAIGLVISIIGLFLSEFAGRALYKNSVVGHIMSYESMRREGAGGDMMRTHIVTIDNTHIDDDRPPYQQMLNRVRVDKDGDMPAKRYKMLIGYGVFIIGLAVAAFWVRTETLNAQESELVANPPAVSQSADDFPAAGGSDFPLPDDMQALSSASAGKSAQDQIDAMHRASLVTFAVLSGLFVFIQASSTYLAFIFGFAGTHSRKAWELTHKFSSADDFVRYHEGKAHHVSNDAQASLGTLQGKQLAVFRVNGEQREKLHADLVSRTFEAYIAEADTKKAIKERKDVIDALGKESRQVIQGYLGKVIADLKAAIANDNNALINRIVADASPRFDQIDSQDEQLAGYKAQFATLRIMGTPAAPAAAVVASPVAANPVAAAPVVAAVVTPVLVDEPVAAASAPADIAPPLYAVPTPAVPERLAFDHNAFGDLTGYEDDDMDYVATKKGVDAATIRRARKLQLLDKSEAS